MVHLKFVFGALKSLESFKSPIPRPSFNNGLIINLKTTQPHFQEPTPYKKTHRLQTTKLQKQKPQHPTKAKNATLTTLVPHRAPQVDVSRHVLKRGPLDDP